MNRLHPITRFTAYLTLVALCLTACNPNRVYEAHKDIKHFVWEKGQQVTFKVDIEKTDKPYSLILAVRHSDALPVERLKVRVTRISPSEAREVSQYTLAMKNEKGRWKGDGMGDIFDVELPMDKLELTEKGTYTFHVEHFMPRENLPLVLEVGLILDRLPR